MQYQNMVQGIFLKRPNRFIAHVLIDGKEEICHVKNTGRCRELLTPGAQVWCQVCDNPARKTKYDLICVQKGDRLINMDSQAPNTAVKEWLSGGGLGDISHLRSEVVFSNSRFDFSFTKDGQQCFMEVKGVTLEHDGVCAFPDAPTQRGARHLQELAQAVREGYGAFVLFVIQMADVKYLRANNETDPSFANALYQAAQDGVTVLAMDCAVTPDTMALRLPVLVKLNPEV